MLHPTSALWSVEPAESSPTSASPQARTVASTHKSLAGAGGGATQLTAKSKVPASSPPVAKSPTYMYRLSHLQK